MLQTAATWIVGVLLVVAYFGGAPAASDTASNTAGTIGVVGGSLAAAAPDLIHGFQTARHFAESHRPGTSPRQSAHHQRHPNRHHRHHPNQQNGR